jgi:hypothetical protein
MEDDGCREPGCERPLVVGVMRLCGTHYQRVWRAGRLPDLPEWAVERRAFPYAPWRASATSEENVEHCVAQVIAGDGSESWSALCDLRVELTTEGANGWLAPGRRCARCCVMLTRVGLME